MEGFVVAKCLIFAAAKLTCGSHPCADLKQTQTRLGMADSEAGNLRTLNEQVEEAIRQVDTESIKTLCKAGLNKWKKSTYSDALNTES